MSSGAGSASWIPAVSWRTRRTPSNESISSLNPTVSDLLLSIAEVAVAFAGFASLVSILGRRSSRDSPVVQAARLRGLIISSLIVVAFAFFPFGSAASVYLMSLLLFLALAGFMFANLLLSFLAASEP